MWMLMIGITGFSFNRRLSRQWQCHRGTLSIFQEAPVATTPMSWSDAIAKPPLGRQEGKGWIFGLDDFRSSWFICAFGRSWSRLWVIDVHVCSGMEWIGTEWNGMKCMYVCMYVRMYVFNIMQCTVMPCHVMQWHGVSCHVLMFVCL